MSCEQEDIIGLNKKDVLSRAFFALEWILASIQKHQGQGSAGYYHLFKGWSKPYPETTGYLIPTLLHYHSLFPELALNNKAASCANWLCQIQNEDGTFHGGIVDEMNQPVIFDMGQILLGLASIHKVIPDDRYEKAIIKLYTALMENIEPDGSWNKWAYVKDYSPAYYTRVIWPMLEAGILLKKTLVKASMKKSLDFYYDKVAQNLSVGNWSFHPNNPAFTHTIAYTMRGFLECGLLLEETKYIHLVQQQCDHVIKLIKCNGRLAGSYDLNWRGDYSFTCLTGNCQLAIIFLKLYQMERNDSYLETALQILQPVRKSQFRVCIYSLKGAIPGSKPFWGPYQRFRNPNWATKFFLDACAILNEL